MLIWLTKAAKLKLYYVNLPQEQVEMAGSYTLVQGVQESLAANKSQNTSSIINSTRGSARGFSYMYVLSVTIM